MDNAQHHCFTGCVRCVHGDVHVFLFSTVTAEEEEEGPSWPPLNSLCDLTSGSEERKQTRLEAADAAAASDCGAI